MIAVIDYGMGNLRSVQKALEASGGDAIVTSSKKKIADASHVVLPGVGAFGDCMRNLREKNLIEPILHTMQSGKPFLGICLGMQVLLEESCEFGKRKGFGLFAGKVKKFPPGQKDESGERIRIPHMGWNKIEIKHRHPLLKGVKTGSYFYFVHSFYADCESDPDIAATCNHGFDFTAAIGRDNIFACQFHPEKSQQNGLKILRNFGGL